MFERLNKLPVRKEFKYENPLPEVAPDDLTGLNSKQRQDLVFNMLSECQKQDFESQFSYVHPLRLWRQELRSPTRVQSKTYSAYFNSDVSRMV